MIPKWKRKIDADGWQFPDGWEGEYMFVLQGQEPKSDIGEYNRHGAVPSLPVPSAWPSLEHSLPSAGFN